MFNESALARGDAPGHQRLLAQIAEARLRAQLNGRRHDAEIFAAAAAQLEFLAAIAQERGSWEPRR